MANTLEPQPEHTQLRHLLAQKEVELRDLSEWQKAILESAAHAIIATAPDGTIVSFNPAAEKLLGYAACEVVGKASPALFHDLGEIQQRALTLSAEIGCTVEPGFDVFVTKPIRGEHEELEWTYIRKDGCRVAVQLSVSPLKNHDDCIIGFLGVAVDLSVHKALEASTSLARAHELSTQVISAVAQGILCLTPHQPYTIRFANAFAAGLLGVSENDLRGQRLDSVLNINAGTIQDPEGRIEKLKPLDSTAFEAEVTTPACPKGFIAAITIARTGNSENAMVVLTFQDITQRRKNEQILRLSSKVFEVSSEAIMITDANATIINVNPAFTWLTGYRPDEILGQTPRILKSGKHDDIFYQNMWADLIANGQWQGEVWDKRKDGSLYPKWVSINAVRENDEVTHYVALAHDISENKEHEKRIQHLAEHDSLTGLPNRRVLDQRATQIIKSERQGSKGFAVVLIDLDRFKTINDTLGHLVGDKVLVETARRLNQSVRNTDTVVRLGGDEFVILLTSIEDPHAISEVVANIHQRLNEAIHVDDRALYAPPSIGIACHPTDGTSIDLLLRNADTAMYQSKAHGGNTWTFYTNEMNIQIAERLVIEDALRSAITEKTLQLHFQPLFDVGSGRIVSWEALLRWEHPTLGNIPPERIIPVAEETGLIHPLGHWVIQTACEQVRRWKDEGCGEFRVSVNISPIQLELPGLEQVIIDALDTSGIAPGQLELEITEGVLMTHSPVATKTLETLRKRGVLLTLDDFGTGYSSLTYLKSLCVDRIKIDRSFVTNILQDKHNASIVRALVMLAGTLELGLVAEGVETSEQKNFLREEGCPEIQGFLMGRPMPPDAVPAFIAALSI